MPPYSGAPAHGLRASEGHSSVPPPLLGFLGFSPYPVGPPFLQVVSSALAETFGIEGPARILAVHCPQGGLSSDGLIAPTVIEVSDSEGGSPRAGRSASSQVQAPQLLLTAGTWNSLTVPWPLCLMHLLHDLVGPHSPVSFLGSEESGKVLPLDFPLQKGQLIRLWVPDFASGTSAALNPPRSAFLRSTDCNSAPCSPAGAKKVSRPRAYTLLTISSQGPSCALQELVLMSG